MKFENWWADVIAPQVYHYTVDTFELVSVSAADPSPLEPGVWLLPGHATFEAPPALADKQQAVFKEGAWVVVPDHRGEVWWRQDFVVVLDLGDPQEWGAEPVKVEGADYLLPEDAIDEQHARIAMRVNGATIVFRDDPALTARRVLAAWEAQGESIAQASFDMSAYEPVPPPPTEEEIVRLNAEAQQRYDAELDAAVERVLEKRRNEETQP